MFYHLVLNKKHTITTLYRECEPTAGTVILIRIITLYISLIYPLGNAQLHFFIYRQ
jgi:hypothetical protein